VIRCSAKLRRCQWETRESGGRDEGEIAVSVAVTTLHVPTVTTLHVPTVTTLHVPTVTTLHVPTVTTLHVPTVTTLHVPTELEGENGETDQGEEEDSLTREWIATSPGRPMVASWGFLRRRLSGLLVVFV
jgi:hypothetical protein